MKLTGNTIFVTGGTGGIGNALRVAGVVCVGMSGRPVQGAAQDGGYVRRLFATGLDRPQAVAPISDTSAFIAERSGRVLLLDGGQRSDLGTIDVQGTRPFYVPDPPYTEGLKDLIPVPGRPGVFLWCMTTGSAQAVRWTVGRARVETRGGARATMRNEVVWQSEPQPWTPGNPPPFSGCRMAADGADVVVATGANSRATGSGRVVRVSVSGSHAPQVVSTGHRNPSGVVLRSGTLWEVEHGPRGGDELNIIVPGGNYGWPAVSKGEPDDGAHRSFLKSRPGSVDPVATWTPAIAPSSLTDWRGKLYVGTLQGGTVIELTPSGTTVVSQRPVLALGKRVRDVRAGPDDHLLWVLTDGPDAELYRVSADQRSAASR